MKTTRSATPSWPRAPAANRRRAAADDEQPDRRNSRATRRARGSAVLALRATSRETQAITGESPNACRARTSRRRRPGESGGIDPDGSTGMRPRQPNGPLELASATTRGGGQQRRMPADVTEQPGNHRARELQPVGESAVGNAQFAPDGRPHVPQGPGRAEQHQVRPPRRSSSCRRRRTPGVGSIISVSRRITSCGNDASNSSPPRITRRKDRHRSRGKAAHELVDVVVDSADPRRKIVGDDEDVHEWGRGGGRIAGT